MELVSPSTAPINPGVKNMHPQSNSTPLSQQSHLPQNLSTMHTSTNVPHNFSNQHHFSSLNMSTSSAPEQHSGIQKSNTAPITSNQSHAIPVQAVTSLVAHDYSVTQEQTISEKSQTNGTSEVDHAPISYPVIPKEKPQPPAPPVVDHQVPQQNAQQHKDIAQVSIAENKLQSSTVPATPKSSSIDAVVAKISPSTIEAKSLHGVTKKDMDGVMPSAVAQTEKEISQEPVTPPTNKQESEPLKPSPLKQVAKPEIQAPKPEESPKVDKTKSEKKVVTPEKEAVKAPIAETVLNVTKKESPQPKTPSKSPARKAKPTQETEKPVVSIPSTSSAAFKRQRIRTQHYQSPLPEVELVSKISTISQKTGDDRLIVFYKNEFLAVRNAEGGFYLCQAVQNIYKTSSKIRIRWLSQTENQEKGEIYTPDFYDLIDFDCILTNLSLSRADKGKYLLPISEKSRTESILNRSIAVEKGEEIPSPSLTAEHPDGLDLSLYRDEDQLKKRKARKRPRKAPPSKGSKETATKKSPEAAKVRKIEAPPPKQPAKKVPARKSVAVTKKSVAKEASTSVSKSSKTASKASSSNKSAAKTNPVVDQKKAKVIARIGRKAAVGVKATTTKNNSKNGNSGNKLPSSVQKAAQPKANSSSSAAKTTSRSVRKSTRK